MKRLVLFMAALALVGGCSDNLELTEVELGKAKQAAMTATTVRVKYERDWDLSGSPHPSTLDGWLGLSLTGTFDVPEGTMGQYTCTNSTPPSNPTLFYDKADSFGQFKHQIPSEETCDLRVFSIREHTGPSTELHHNGVWRDGGSLLGYVDILDISTGFQQVTIEKGDTDWRFINALGGLVHLVDRFMDSDFGLNTDNDYVRAAYEVDIWEDDGNSGGNPMAFCTLDDDEGYDMSTCSHELGHAFLNQSWSQVHSTSQGFPTTGGGEDPDYPAGCEHDGYDADVYFSDGRSVIHEVVAHIWQGLVALETIDDITNPDNSSYYGTNATPGVYGAGPDCSSCPFLPDLNEYPLFAADTCPGDSAGTPIEYISSGRRNHQYKAVIEALDSRQTGGDDCLTEALNIDFIDFWDTLMSLGSGTAEGETHENYVNLSYRFGNAVYYTDSFNVMDIINELPVQSSTQIYVTWANACYFAMEIENNVLENSSTKTGVAYP